MSMKRCLGLFLVGGMTSVLGCSVGDSSGTSTSEAAVTSSKIEHVVVIVQENHTFDAYFGRYCKATPGQPLPSKCGKGDTTVGPDCCEAAPDTVDGHDTGLPILPMSLTDATNTVDVRGLDRNHDSACEYLEMRCGVEHRSGTAQLGDGPGGADRPDATCAMDRFIDKSLGAIGESLSKAGGKKQAGGGSGCGSILGVGLTGVTASNWAIADPDDELKIYRDLAKNGALGDRYFQPTVGQTSSNNMFLATAQFEFRDNTWFPNTAGSKCQAAALPNDHQPNYHTIKNRTTIADLLLDKLGDSGFGYYHMGFGDMTDRQAEKDVHGCPKTPLPDLCPSLLRNLSLPDHEAVKDPRVACMNDPSDNPFRYFEQFGDDGKHIGALHDYKQFAKDVAAEKLPAVSYIKAVTAVDEHPAFGPLSTGQEFVKQTIAAIQKSPTYKENTLILITWDEGGGFYDHVSPPAVYDPHGAVNGQGLHTNSETAGPGWMRLGTRIPILAIGKFARKNSISHVQMEHSSIVKFLEWNFLDKQTGQLGGRESQVNNIGSLLDPELAVPEKDGTPHAR